MASSPLVSVITCSHDRPAMLAECVASMQTQTVADWEHLITDDASTEPGVHALLDETARADQRVRVFRKSTNLNQPGRYWNEMIDRARGRYVTFLDDDNLKDHDFIARLASVLDADPAVDMVTCGFKVLDDSSGSVSENHLNLHSDEEIERRSTIDTASTIIRREALEKIGYFPLDIRTNEDWALMRRAVACLRIVHLPDALTTYRVHAGQRMGYCEDLGNSRDQKIILGSVWGRVYGARVYGADEARLTQSQRDVVAGARAGVDAIDWVDDGSDLAVVLMPFQIDEDELEKIARRYHTVVSVHSEDPFALTVNVGKVRALLSGGAEVWVCTNDTTCVGDYQALVGDRVVACPSLSIDHRAEVVAHHMRDRPVDVALVGYAYPSRIKFVRELSSHFDTTRLCLVGDGWAQAGSEATPTRPHLSVAQVYGDARAVICLHRGHGDCVDGPHEPKLVQRGYVEGMGGARVFVDNYRPDHLLDAGDVEWFDSPEDLATKLDAYLALPDDEQVRLAEPLRERAWLDFTYRTRMARVINAVRSRRFMAVIP